MLFTAAWTANPPHTNLPVVPTEVHARETPNYVTQTAPHTLAWPHHEVTGTLIPHSEASSDEIADDEVDEGVDDTETGDPPTRAP